MLKDHESIGIGKAVGRPILSITLTPLEPYFIVWVAFTPLHDEIAVLGYQFYFKLIKNYKNKLNKKM